MKFNYQKLLRRIIVGAKFYGTKFIKWVLISAAIGIVCGLVGYCFYSSVRFATRVREAHSWLIFLLPLGGALIILIYGGSRMFKRGTNEVIDSIHNGDQVPIVLVPVIFVATFITHLVGGSAGREGAALQIGGGLGCETAKLIRLDDKDRRVATLCGMSAVFAALFGTPLTSTIFALEVISVGIFYYSALLPCLLSSLCAYGISTALGMEPVRYTVEVSALSVFMVVKVIVLAIACAAVSIVFCESMHISEKWSAILFKNPYIKAPVGGAIILVLTLLLRTGIYNGAGEQVIASAIEYGTAPAAGFILKIIFTAVSLGFGFKGGEIVPSFFIGACLGCTFGPLIGMPAGFAAAIGLVALFCGAFNCPIASIILSIELFGAEGVLYFAVAAAISYMLSGYFGIYKTQKIVYSKVKAEYIDQKTK